MKPVINLQEKIGKVVGKRQPPADSLSLEHSQKKNAVAWREAFGGLQIPKGVYRFKSHEEADAWLRKMIARPRSN